MSSTWSTSPEIYNKKNIAGTTEKQPVYIQFVPGLVVSVITSEDNKDKSTTNRINSIVAQPHITDSTIPKYSTANDEFRYYPLLRGMSDTPTPGDPVMLFTMGGVQYYLGPLNSDGLPNFNKDKYINN